MLDEKDKLNFQVFKNTAIVTEFLVPDLITTDRVFNNMQKMTNDFLIFFFLYIAFIDISYAYDSNVDKKSCRESNYHEDLPYWKCVDEKFKLKDEYMPRRPQKKLEFLQLEQKRSNQQNRIYNYNK